MKSHTIPFKLLCGICLWLPLAAANALMIDFTGPAWDEGPAPYATSLTNTVGGVDVTATANPAGASLYQDSTDGLGVRFSYEVDEIEKEEVLVISFDRLIRLNSIGLSDLFIETGLTGSFAGGPGTSANSKTFAETGWYTTVHGTTGFEAVQPTSGTNGELLISGLNLLIDSISFTAPGKIWAQNLDGSYSWQDHEYSLQSLEISEVPLPAAFWMFGSALFGFVAMSRRTKV